MSRWANKYVIGLTGNIAVGKSVVRQMLQHLGAYTIDADALAHKAMYPGAPAYQPVVDTFGQVILNPDKTINRTMLGNMVFGNPALLKKLEDVTHPVIGQAINTLVSRAKQRVVVIEAIKLLEGNLRDSVDVVWVVNASPKTQYSRLISKRKMSEEDAKQRILGQSDQKEKLKAADVVIKNDGNVEETWKQVQASWDTVKAALTPAAPPAPAQPAAPAQPTASEKPATEAKPAAPAPTPAPTADKAVAADTSGITVRRGMPNHAEVIASFITKETGKEVSRMDVIMTFGQKSYLIAESGDTTIGVIGWQVENLITRVDELYLEETTGKEKTVYALVNAVEDASQELQSEVSFVFLPATSPQERMKPFLDAGYDVTTISEIKIPAWREAVQEVISGAEGEDLTILNKKLRENLVSKPI